MSVKGTPAFGTYGATKAAVRNLVRTWTMAFSSAIRRCFQGLPQALDAPVNHAVQPVDLVVDRPVRFGDGAYFEVVRPSA
jgi:NAD(P)-dependent dehydrogenase (short-subunit alcohol dehydrogenase family)